ncbi:MAG: acetate--CoA ligase [Chlamydiae bacterium]|nr:acetate--CoA ligase [Chlamydiota bacterium]
MNTEVVAPAENFKRESNIKDGHLYEYANKNRIAFWEGCAQGLSWYKKWNSVLEWDSPFAKWYEGGRLNACYNCLDRHMLTPVRHKTALFWENEQGDSRAISYEELYYEVNRLANALKALGVKKGDCVAIYLPMIPEAVASMLACARIGAVHTVVFGGFSAEALRSRIVDANAKVLITADASVRKGKYLPLKETADKAVQDLTCIEKVLVVQRGLHPIVMQPKRDVFYHEALAKAEAFCEPTGMESEDVLFILYTSGTTGKPKGIIHSTAGYLVGAYVTTRLVFDVKPTDVFWCTADIGWITGHTYIVYGPFANGMTQVLYEGSPDQPGKDCFWKLIEKYKVTTFYTAPTAIRMFMKWGTEYLQGKDLSSLRLLGSVGEPLNPEAWQWYYHHIGGERCPIVDTWWQTETGSILMSTLPGIMSMKPGYVGKALPGIDIKLLDDYGHESRQGYVAVMSPWPSMLRGIQGDTRRFLQTYWNKWGGRYYFAGDAAGADDEGRVWIQGRVDDTINVAAHRLGTMEIESILLECDGVAESAVLGIPDEVTGQAIAAFVVLKEGFLADEAMKETLKQHVVEKIGAIARPKQIFFAEDIPKTRSGKIMRRLLRDLALGRSLGDMTTLEDTKFMKVLEKNLQKTK